MEKRTAGKTIKAGSITTRTKVKIMLDNLITRAHENYSDVMLLLAASPNPMVEISKMIAVAALSSFATNLITTARLEERIIYIQDAIKSSVQEQDINRITVNELQSNVALLQYKLDEHIRNDTIGITGYNGIKGLQK